MTSQSFKGLEEAYDWVKDAAQDAKERAERGVSTQVDPIKPSHYNVGGIETIDFIRAKLTKEEYKGGLEDFKKAEVYMQWLVENEEKE